MEKRKRKVKETPSNMKSKIIQSNLKREVRNGTETQTNESNMAKEHSGDIKMKPTSEEVTEFDNNAYIHETNDCYSSKHKKFRKRSYASSTSDCSVGAPSSEIEPKDNVKCDEKLKNLPIKKRRRFLENDASQLRGSLINVQNESSNDSKSAKLEVKSKTHVFVGRRVFCQSNTKIYSYSENEKSLWSKYSNHISPPISDKSVNGEHQLKCEAYESLDKCMNEVRTIKSEPCESLRLNERFISETAEFYQKRKVTDKDVYGPGTVQARGVYCLYCTTHVKFKSSENRNCTKPCAFHRNGTHLNSDWTVNATHTSNIQNQLRLSANPDTYSEYYQFNNLHGGSVIQFSNIPHKSRTNRITKPRINYSRRKKHKYEGKYEKNQAICAAGPEMAKGKL